MSKDVLISIRPKGCMKIESGEMTIEVRKTRPNLLTPFKCYIYRTLPKSGDWCEKDGKVIGEFVCDKIYELAPINHAPYSVEQQACLTREEIVRYIKGIGYAWHISDLIIYDKPKELQEFKPWNRTEDMCYYSHLGLAIPKCENCHGCKITRPPQSWCYVEAVQ